MHSLVPFLLLGLTATNVLARTAAQNARGENKTTTVLVLGDSLSAGYGLRRSEAFPALLAERAGAAGFQVNIINAGVSGGTTTGALYRLPELLERHIDVLVLELGINDAFREVPVTQIESNLQKIIDRTRARYPEVRLVVVGMQLPGYAADDYVTQFGAMYAEFAKRNQAALVPFLLQGVLGNPQLNLPDLIHPNASGQKVLAANVWPVLESVLKSVISLPSNTSAKGEVLKMDPADPHNLHDTADKPVLERIDIATEGNDCHECVRRLREPLMRIQGVKEVTADAENQRVWVTFDARKTHAPDLHDAILRSGYKPAPMAG